MSRQQLPAPTIAWLVAGVFLTIICGGIYYLLREADDVRSGLMLWMLPIVTGCFAAAKLEQNQDEQRKRGTQQTEQLSKISHQTNGILDDKIKRCVKTVLDERDAERHRSTAPPGDVDEL